MRDYHAVQANTIPWFENEGQKSNFSLKAEDGWWPGCVPPHGYSQQKRTNKRGFERRRGTIIVPDPDPMIVRRVRIEFENPSRTTNSNLSKSVTASSKRFGYKRDQKVTITWNIQRRLENIFYDARFMWAGVEQRQSWANYFIRNYFEGSKLIRA